ncbi:MAG: hypothetical protein NWE96_09880 [Candidatus Bathyarchaeota archaeon]|nr:hypothetical protein [Candidatus Bathyarchaeota archaeon]
MIISIRFFYSIVTVGKSNINCNTKADKQLRQDSIEDSQGDGLFIADDDSEELFPEEFDD